MDIAIMLEGQNGLTWPRWQRIARTVEELGFAGLYRSDHFTNPNPPDLASLELWISLTWLASHTERIEFGPLVAPVSFRNPIIMARQASAIDDLSGGRLRLGLGAGWQEREHTSFGFALGDVPQRFARFTEGLEVTRLLLTSDTPVSFAGEYYQLQDAILLPRPARPGGPPIVIGGNGPQRTLPLVAQYAAEWNGVFIPPARFAELSAQLDGLLRQRGRQPDEVRRTVMAGLAFGRDEAELNRILHGRNPDESRARGLVVGTPEQVVEQVAAYAEAGAARVMLQWLDLDDMERLAALAETVLPQFPSQPRPAAP